MSVWMVYNFAKENHLICYKSKLSLKKLQKQCNRYKSCFNDYFEFYCLEKAYVNINFTIIKIPSVSC